MHLVHTLHKHNYILFPIIGSVLLFAALKLVIAELPVILGASGISLVGAILAIAAILLIPMRAIDCAYSTRLMVRGITLLFTIFIIGAPVSVPAEDLEALGLPAEIFHDGRWLVIGVSLIAWFRPSLSLLILAHVWISKAAYQSITDLAVSKTDWMVVWEAGVFLVIGSWMADRWRVLFGLDKSARWRAEEWILLIVVAVHFANYLYSGLAKLALGPAPWTWLIENPTNVLMVTSWEMGLLPLAISKELAGIVYNMADASPIFINAATLIGQLLTLFAISRIVWQRWLTVYFDLQHITIFLLTGIFFWKWIIFNLLLVVALGRITLVKLDRPKAIALLATMICAPLIFHVVYLAWYDTRVLNDVRLIAVTEKGEDIELATNTALFGSVTFTQSRAGGPFGGAAITDSLGATTDYKKMRSFKECDNPDFAATDTWRHSGSEPNLEALRQILRSTFSFVADQPFYASDFAHLHVYAHHVFSNPWLYEDMQGIRLNDIAAVDVAVTARCSYLDENGPASIMLADGRWRILDANDMSALR